MKSSWIKKIKNNKGWIFLFIVIVLPILSIPVKVHYEFVETSYIHRNIVNDIFSKKLNFFEKLQTKSLLNYRFKRPSHPVKENYATWHCYVNFYPLMKNKTINVDNKNLVHIKSGYYGECLSSFMSNGADPKNKKWVMPTYTYVGKEERFGKHWDLLARGSINNIALTHTTYKDKTQKEVYEYKILDKQKSKYRHFIIIDPYTQTVKVISAYAKCSSLNKLFSIPCVKKQGW